MVDTDALTVLLKWNSNIVPQTSSASEKVLMAAFFDGNNKVIAARGKKYLRLAQVVAGQRLIQDVLVQVSIHTIVTT